MLEQHAAMCEVVDEVAEAMRPGVSFAELMRLGRQGFVSRDIPLRGRFTHVGHGIGLETEEEWIDDDESRTIEEEMVVAIELYAVAGEHGAVGDEETYVIRSNGRRAHVAARPLDPYGRGRHLKNPAGSRATGT